MNPELPFLAAGAVALVGGTATAKRFPPPGAVNAVFGTVLLVIVASATAGTRAAPIVRAFGLLVLLVATMATIPKLSPTLKGKK